MRKMDIVFACYMFIIAALFIGCCTNIFKYPEKAVYGIPGVIKGIKDLDPKIIATANKYLNSWKKRDFETISNLTSEYLRTTDEFNTMVKYKKENELIRFKIVGHQSLWGNKAYAIYYVRMTKNIYGDLSCTYSFLALASGKNDNEWREFSYIIIP